MAMLSVECHKFLNVIFLQNPATNSPRPSQFRVTKISIYAMPNPDYHKIDLKAP